MRMYSMLHSRALVRPHARAGVEMHRTAAARAARGFALMRGRELKLRRLGYGGGYRQVRPHARAGVEMPVPHVIYFSRRKFALMRGRELKSGRRFQDSYRNRSPSCEGGS